MEGVEAMTYGEIYTQFLKKSGISESRINDYRPCCDLFDVPFIPNAIVVWLNDGGKIIYIAA